MFKKIIVLILGMVSFGSVFIQPVQGAEYPKEIEIYNAYTAGSPVDILCRLVADTAPKYMSQTFTVVNKPGAAGSLAAAEVISSKPGSKLFLISQFFRAITVKTQKVPFDANYLVPLHTFMRYQNGMTVKGDSPWKTLNDMLDYARKNPNKLKWGHHGRGATTHLAGLMIFVKAGVKTIDVPYPGSPELLAAVLGGHVDISTLSLATTIDHVKAGKIRYLVSFGDSRFREFPDIPCALELGYPEAASMATDLGLYAHKDTPEELKQSLVNGFKKICGDPEFKEKVRKLGEEVRCDEPKVMAESIKQAEEIGVPIIKELGLYIGN